MKHQQSAVERATREREKMSDFAIKTPKITSVSYDLALESVTAFVDVDANEPARVIVSFKTDHVIDSERVSDIEAIVPDDARFTYVNDAVFAAAVVATLNHHTTDETDVPLCVEIDTPLELIF
jgi:hypothetical protein